MSMKGLALPEGFDLRLGYWSSPREYQLQRWDRGRDQSGWKPRRVLITEQRTQTLWMYDVSNGTDVPMDDAKWS